MTNSARPSLQAQIEALQIYQTGRVYRKNPDGLTDGMEVLFRSDVLALLAFLPAQEPAPEPDGSGVYRSGSTNPEFKEWWKRFGIALVANRMMNTEMIALAAWAAAEHRSVAENVEPRERCTPDGGHFSSLQDRDAELTCALQVAEEQVSSLKRQQALMAEAHRAEVVALRAEQATLREQLEHVKAGKWTQLEIDAAKWRAHEQETRNHSAISFGGVAVSLPLEHPEAEVLALRAERDKLSMQVAELHDLVSGYDAITDPEQQPELHDRAFKGLGDDADHTICRALEAAESRLQRLQQELGRLVGEWRVDISEFVVRSNAENALTFGADRAMRLCADEVETALSVAALPPPPAGTE